LEDVAMSTHQSGAENRSYTGEYAADAWGGLLAGLGLTGVVATSVLYGMSPPEAALPGMMTDLAAAQAAAQQGGDTMRAAGLVGMISDGIYAPAAMLLSMGLWRTRPAAAIGWAALAFCGLLFIVVDALVAFALPGAAAAQPGFATAKYLFDGLFLTATLISGAGALLVYVTAAVKRTFVVPRWLGWLGVLVALIVMTTAAAGIAGHPLGQLAGVSVMVGSALGVVLTAFIAINALRRGA
jgi:hypothetical protein